MVQYVVKKLGDTSHLNLCVKKRKVWGGGRRWRIPERNGIDSSMCFLCCSKNKFIAVTQATFSLDAAKFVDVHIPLLSPDMFVFELKGLHICKVLDVLNEKACLLKLFYLIVLFYLH